jgi:hypothetical protein
MTKQKHLIILIVLLVFWIALIALSFDSIAQNHRTRADLGVAQARIQTVETLLTSKTEYAEEITAVLDSKVAEIAGLEAMLAEKDAIIAEQSTEIDRLK